MTFRLLVVTITATAATWLPMAAQADPFSFSTGIADGRLGALSQPATQGNVETEAADGLRFVRGPMRRGGAGREI